MSKDLRKLRYEAILNACMGDFYNIADISKIIRLNRTKVSIYCKTLAEYGYLNREKFGRDIVTEKGGSAPYLYSTIKTEMSDEVYKLIAEGHSPNDVASEISKANSEKIPVYDGKPRVVNARHNKAKGIRTHATYGGHSSLGML